MASFLLIHGGWQGAWCWREFALELERWGHRAVAIDLPGHGNDPAPPETVAFHDYVDAVRRAVESLPGPCILAGHSMTTILSQTAEAIPDRVQALIYIAGYLLPSGVSILEVVDRLDPEFLSRVLWS